MSFSRKLKMEDLINISKEKEKDKENNLYKNLNQIPKNQEVFGHKKRIKP